MQQRIIAVALESFVEYATILLLSLETEYSDELGFKLQSTAMVADEIIELLQ